MSNLYLDLAVVRIGEYIGRWPGLRGARGASAMITAACSPEVLGPIGDQYGAELHDEAGTADGVATFKAPADVDGRRLAMDLLATLRRELPSAGLRATWAIGSNYGAAYAEGLGSAATAENSLVGSEPLSEFPFAARCELTGGDMAAASVEVPKEEPRLGGMDAGRRNTAARNRFAANRDIVAAWDPDQERGLQIGHEARLALAVRKPEVTETFDDLADTVQHPEFKSNHLALVYTDGDRIGELMASLPEEDKAKVSKGLKDATEQALEEATREVDRLLEAANLPVIPHIVGGDDVLVSVPAPVAWPFVRTFLKTFEAKAPAGRSVTASAGVVIANVSAPFNDSFLLCEQLQRKAKRDEPLASSALWLDVTRDGPGPVDRRSSVSLAKLDSMVPLLDELAALEKSRRHELARALDSGDMALPKLRRLARRHLDAEEPAQYWPETEPKTLRQALSLANWWWIES